ncbi:hypothetical protein SCB71_01205 [Herbiconiux sp. KACC 21604]|uniref:hypothetical protein n=1 Tax=unclassified Herbiconiux TaxID=2618217 RepID=UPI001490CF67|nr:hypothetical protein [Herbiconiux sp. SALV-R1]QJU55683.1 hypothetical protein HL652_20060 [Herbiconiux sp. SALV-R1]WPO86886.1 hypothetical protein SCB71_01205 [Herbiconiux sp. KACC 21604]
MVLEILEVTGRLQELGALVYVLYSIYKELRWTPLSTRGEWGVPTIFGLIGAISLLNTGLLTATPIEWALLAGAVAVALACGLVAGRVARFRPLSERSRAALEHRAARRAERRGRSGPRPLPAFEMRTGWIGALLWAVTLGTRYGAEYLGEHLDAALATTTGLAFLLVAVNEAGRVLVVSRRSPAQE